MTNYNFTVIAICLSSIALGILLANQFHTDYVYPMDKAREILVKVQSTSDPQTIQNDLIAVKRLLPVKGNPSIFSTGDTDFGLMQNALDAMIGTVDNISQAPSSSTEFHTGMLNVHTQATTLVFNILDATPYMYLSLPFVIANAVWLLGIIELVRYTSTKRK